MKLETDDVQIPLPDGDSTPVEPAGVDRRTFLMRSAVIGSAAVITGRVAVGRGAGQGRDRRRRPRSHAVPRPERGEEVEGAGHDHARGVLQGRARARRARTPSARCASPTTSTSAARSCPRTSSRRPPALKVHLFGSLSATGKGHGTERAALAGIIGKEPATVEPAFLDSLAAKPDQIFPVKLGDKTFNVSLKDIIYDAPKGDFPHPNTMTCKLMAGERRAPRAGVLLGRRRVHRVEGLHSRRRRGSRSTPTPR